MSIIHSNNFESIIEVIKNDFIYLCNNYDNTTEYVLNNWMNNSIVFNNKLLTNDYCNDIINKEYTLDVNNTGLYILFYLSTISFFINCCYHSFRFINNRYHFI
jgi:hypothetical protein